MARAVTVIGASLISVVTVAGCGNAFGRNDGDSAGRFLYVTECDGDGIVSRMATDLIVLDWSGGRTPLYPRRRFAALDLSLFETAEGGTLADDAELFKELVRQQITYIYCESSAPPIRVRQADDREDSGETTVHFTQDLSPTGECQVGEGEYDPCNVQHDNVALIFGEQLRQLGRRFTFDDWVMAFANVAAHEIGHMLGYGHVIRTEHPDTGRSIFVELMLDGHSVHELHMEQRFIVDLSNCPEEMYTLGRSIQGSTCSPSDRRSDE